MDYSEFVSWAKEQSEQTKFSEYEDCLDMVPEEVRGFYRACNPVHAEVPYNGNGVAFYPVEGLAELQEDYAYLNAQFIFATCNSDPFFINDKQVFTCPHGVRQPQWEKLSDSFSEFLQMLIQGETI